MFLKYEDILDFGFFYLFVFLRSVNNDAVIEPLISIKNSIIGGTTLLGTIYL